MSKIDLIIERCERQIASAETHIAKHAERMKSNPHHAMQWADSVFEASAEWKVAHVILGMCDASETGEQSPREFNPAEIVAEVERMVLQDAANVKRSSSQSANITDVYTTAAYADSLRGMRGILRGMK